MSTQFLQRLPEKYLSSEKSWKQLPTTLQPEWDLLFDYFIFPGPHSQDAKDQFLTPEKLKSPFIVSDRRRNKANTLFNRAVSLRLEGSYDAALKLFQEELEIRKELSSGRSRDKDIADTFNQIGICFDGLNNSKKALEYLKDSLKIRRTITKDKSKDKDIAAILFNMGISHKNLDNHQEGLKHFQDGLFIQQNLALNKKNKPLIAKYFNQIGLCHFYLNQFDKALNNFSSALEFMDSSSSDEDTQTFVSTCLFNEGICFAKLDKMDDAFRVWEKSSHILLKSVSDKNALTRRYQQIGLMLMDKNNYKEAAKYFTSRLDVLKEINTDEKLNENIAGTLLTLGVCYGNMHLPEKALECLQEGLSIQRQLPQDDQRHSITAKYHTNIGICYAQLKRHEQALQYFRSALECQHKAIADDDTMRITVRLHCLMAMSFLGTGKLEEAFLEFKNSIEIGLKISLKESKDKSDADLFFRFGLCLIGLGRQNEAIEKFQEALDVLKHISVNIEVDEDIATYSYVVGICLVHNNAPQEALTFFENGLAIREKTSPEIKRNEHVALFLNQIGKCLFDLDKLDEALFKHLSAMEIQREASTDLARDENAAAYFFNAGVCLQKLNRHDEALECFNSALEIQKNISDDTDSDDVHVLATLSHIIDSLFTKQRFSEIKILLQKHPVLMTLWQCLEITILILKCIASAAYEFSKQSMATGKEKEALSHFKAFVAFRKLFTVQHLIEVPAKSEQQQQQTTSQMALSVCSTSLEETRNRQSPKDSCHETKIAGTGGETFSSKETSSTYITLCTSAIVNEDGDVIKFGSCEIHIPPGALEEYIFFKFALKHKPSIAETSENIVLTPTLQCSPSQTFKRPVSIKMPTCYRTTENDVLVTPETNDGCGWKKLDPVEVQDDYSISFSTTSFCEKRIEGTKANFNVKKMMFICEKSSEESSDPVIKWKMVENLPDVHDIESAWTFSVEVRKKQNLIVEMICHGAESEPAQTKIRSIQIFKDVSLITGQFTLIKDNEQITLENVECKLKDADTKESVASKSFQFHSLSEKAPETVYKQNGIESVKGAEDEVNVLHTTQAFYDGHLGNKDIYQVKEKPKGRVLILSNTKFPKWKAVSSGVQGKPKQKYLSRGAEGEKEHRQMKKLFEGLGCLVRVKLNQSAEEMLAHAKKFSQKRHTNFSVLCMMSHGKSDVERGTLLFGSDCTPVSVSEIVQMFCKSQSLDGKPKIFFFQCCREYGEKDIAKMKAIFQDSSTPEQILQQLRKSVLSVGYENKGPADLLLGFSTSDGFTSERGLYVSSIVRIFSKEAKDEHLLDLMTKVKNEVYNQSKSISDGSMQLSDTLPLLMKKLYLYPGILHKI